MFLKRLRPFIVIPGLLFLLFLSGLLWANSLIQKPSVQAYLVDRLSDITGYHIRTRKIELNLWRGVGVLVHGLEASIKDGPESITASRVRIILDPKQLLKRRIVPVSIYLYEPLIELAMVDIKKSPADEAVPLLFRAPDVRSVSIEKGHILFKNRNYDLEDLFLQVQKRKLEPSKLLVSSRGNVSFKGQKIPFNVRGTAFQEGDGKRFPYADLTVETGRIPLAWLPWPSYLPVKEGDFMFRGKVEGDVEGPLSVEGDITVRSLRFSLHRGGREKGFDTPEISLRFRSVLEGSKLNVPALHIKTREASMDMEFLLDMEDLADPYLDFNANSLYMTVKTFKKFFPSPLLPPWLDKRLFPMFLKGDVRINSLLMKGRFNQLEDMDLPENHAVFTLKVDCQHLEILAKKGVAPFRDVSGLVSYENGDLLISRLKAVFANSSIGEGEFLVRNLPGDKPVFESMVDGSFDLKDLMARRSMDIVPPDIIQKLDQLAPISGRLECKARFRYETGWEFPRTTAGKFIFRNFLIDQKELLFPLSLEEVQIHIEKKNGNRFRGRGKWGNSDFAATGVFGGPKEKFSVKWANLSTDMDMNQVLPLFYPEKKFPLLFSKPLPGRISMSREQGHWACQGSVDLEGVVAENDKILIDPPGAQDMIFFDLDFHPGKNFDVRKLRFELGDSSLEFSGFYDLKSRDIFSFTMSIPSLAMKDLGIRFKQRELSAEGVLKGHIRVLASRSNPLITIVIGRLEGHDLSFFLDPFHSPVSECLFKVDFSGKNVTIDRWRMKIGESPVELSGGITGWDELRGEISADFDFLNANDILAQAKRMKPDNFGEQMDRATKNVDIRLRLNAIRGRWKKLGWGPLRSEIRFKGGDIRILRLNVGLGYGDLSIYGDVNKTADPGMLFFGHLQLYNQPVEDLLKELEIEDMSLTGDLTLEALFHAKAKNWKGLLAGLSGSTNILLEKGVIQKSSSLIKMLDFLSLQKIFKKKPPNIEEEGLYFESIGGHAVIDEGTLETENFMMQSRVFNAVATGKVDLVEKKIDYTLGIQPLETIDFLVSKIPILGYALTGKEKSFLTYYFKVEGPLFKPNVDYVPFKNLGGGAYPGS